MYIYTHKCTHNENIWGQCCSYNQEHPVKGPFLPPGLCNACSVHTRLWAPREVPAAKSDGSATWLWNCGQGPEERPLVTLCVRTVCSHWTEPERLWKASRYFLKIFFFFGILNTYLIGQYTFLFCISFRDASLPVHSSWFSLKKLLVSHLWGFNKKKQCFYSVCGTKTRSVFIRKFMLVLGFLPSQTTFFLFFFFFFFYWRLIWLDFSTDITYDWLFYSSIIENSSINCSLIEKFSFSALLCWPW